MESVKEKVNETTRKDEDRRCSVRTFFDSTSLHGARFLNDRNIFIRLTWLIALGLSFGFCCHQIHRTLESYYDWPFSTSISRVRAKELEFPAVTICNLNPISKRQYARSVRATTGLNKTDEELEHEIQLIISIMQTNHNGLESTEPEVIKLKQQLNKSRSYRERGHNWLMQTISNYSHRIEDMLGLDWLEPCKWRGVGCSAENFTVFINLKQGQCYTFNSGKDGHPRLKSSIPGSTNGLRLRLNVEEEDHVSHAQSIIAGFKVSVQHQDDYPMVEEFGFALEPGTHTFAALRQKKIKNLRAPYKSNCSSPELPFSKAYNSSYSVNNCIINCINVNLMESCGCQPLLTIFPGVEVCSMKDTFDCVYPKLTA